MNKQKRGLDRPLSCSAEPPLAPTPEHAAASCQKGGLASGKSALELLRRPMRISRLLCSTCLLAMPFEASAFDWCRQPALNINGVSKHFYKTSYSNQHGWNQLNSGLGLTCKLDGLAGRFNDEVEAGFYRNSFRESSVYAAYGVYLPVNPGFSAGVRTVITTGFGHYTSKFVAGPAPTVKFHLSQTVVINVSVAVRKKAFIFANAGIDF
jgi:hypothetical protein